jgi:hypothetical protein
MPRLVLMSRACEAQADAAMPLLCVDLFLKRDNIAARDSIPK